MNRASHHLQRSSSRAFTLIELMVVISIISLLASIVITSLGTARDKARIASALTFEATVRRSFGAESYAHVDFDNGSSYPISDSQSTPIITVPSCYLQYPNPGCAARYSNNTPSGQGYSLEAPDSYGMDVDYQTPLRIGDYTLSLWINPTTALGERSQLIDATCTDTTGCPVLWDRPMRVFLYNPDSNGYTLIKIGPYGEYHYIPVSVPFGKWSHITITRKDSTDQYELYIDGKLVYTGTGSGNPLPGDGYINTIDVGPPGGSESFDGYIDSFGFYSQTLIGD